jgi:hypothetical protein
MSLTLITLLQWCKAKKSELTWREVPRSLELLQEECGGQKQQDCRKHKGQHCDRLMDSGLVKLVL